jgi:hypothetical protein
MQSYCYALAGVQIVPPSKKVPGDVLMLLLMVGLFTYTAILMWKADFGRKNKDKK